MKQLFLSLFVILFAFESAIPDSLDKYLIAYWSFDEGSAADYSGNCYDGQIMGNPTFIKGIKGQAIRIVGCCYDNTSGDHVLLPRINFESFNEITISIWVNEETFINDQLGTGEAYINWGSHTDGWIGIMNHYLQAPIYSTNLNLQASVGSDNSTQNYNLYYYYDLKNKYNWVHYCMTYKNGILSLYQNGNLVGRKNQNLNISTNDGAIGRHWWYKQEGCSRKYVSSNRITASFDEVKIYNKALDESEIKNQLLSSFYENFENDYTTCSLFPNPSNNYVYFKCNPKLIENYILVIYDLTGNIIYSEIIENTGNDSFFWDASLVSDGIYFFNISSGTFNKSGKIIIVK